MTTTGRGPTTVEELRAAYPPASERSQRKEIDHLDEHCRAFLALSPFCVLATVDADGGPDVSPRGGDPGFVAVRDPRTALLPDRPGNYRIDSLRHVVEAPSVCLLVMVPGIDETLRVYGRARVVTMDAAVRAEIDADPKGRTMLEIRVQRAFFHCAKALMRSGLWDPQRQVEREVFPTMGQLMRDHARTEGPAESQEEMLRRYEPTL